MWIKQCLLLFWSLENDQILIKLLTQFGLFEEGQNIFYTSLDEKGAVWKMFNIFTIFDISIVGKQCLLNWNLKNIKRFPAGYFFI